MSRRTGKREEGRILVRLPKFPKHCCECGRKLDGRMTDNPYGCWSVPTMVPGKGTFCTYCHSKCCDGFDPQQRLAPGCEALKKLAVWLALPGKEVA